MKTNHHVFFSVCLVLKNSKQGVWGGGDCRDDVLFCILKVYNAFRTSLDECLSTQSDISVSEIDLQLEQLQKELISKALSNEDFAELNSQILDLKERKQKILSDGVRLKQLKEKTNKIMKFIESRSDLITEYNDTLVRYFVEKIHVYEDRLSVELKIGDSVDIVL